MLSAFFDDSGVEQKVPRTAVIGGYVAISEQAIKLAEDWSGIFARDGVKSFHMGDFENGFGEYVGWKGTADSRFKRIKHIESLAYLLNLRSLCYIGAGTLIDVFDEAVNADLTEEDKGKIGGPHAFCFQLCLEYLSHWVKDHFPDETVAVFYENGTKLGSELFSLFKRASDSEDLRKKHKIEQLLPLGKDTSVGILPADLVAYELYKYNYNRKAAPSRPLRKSMEAMLQNNKLNEGRFFHDPVGVRQYFQTLRDAGIIGSPLEPKIA